jgi:hypothetical protein
MGAGMGTGGAKHSLVKTILSSIPLAELRSATGRRGRPKIPKRQRSSGRLRRIGARKFHTDLSAAPPHYSCVIPRIAP